MMRYFAGGLFKISVFIVVVFSVTLTLLRLSSVLFPEVQEPSPTFDCDDSTLFMYHYYQRLGVEVTPIVGNLDMAGEEYMECNHVWLLVKSGDKNIAYDWGKPQFDKPYYEGYIVNLDYLLYAIADDMNNGDAWLQKTNGFVTSETILHR